ncbi:MAG: amidohydrolase family protein [SAR202 cluster bacterium]|nr:amidohydrolase family protein [SAR202 cluster bacterium]MDP6511764.1 amidohydrolase family protein [SAR202 cluster bacterium]
MPTNGGFKLITASRLIDAKGGPPIDNGAVLVQGTSILAVGRASEVAAPEGADVQIMDYPGKTVMPGMVDCHTHHNGFGDGRAGDELALLDDEILTLQSARNARSSLYSGVTSIRENGPKNYTMFRLRDSINMGITVGPRMVLCGRPVAIIGGHMGYFGSEVTGPIETRAMTRQLIKEGADYIKVTATGGSTRTSFPLKPSFTVEELLAITDEAHKFGKLTATHCVSSQGIANSLDADVDMIIHCVFKEGDGTDVFRQDIADRIGEKGVFVNPTLHVGRSSRWKLEHKQEAQGLTPEEATALEAAYRNNEVRLEDSRKMIEMGLKLITGSDSSWGDYQLGNTVYETELLVEAGYTAMQGVQSVTSEAAKALGLDNIVGTLEAGKEADIIIVDGDPSQDINALWNIDEVFLAGEDVDRGSFDSNSTVRQPPVV